MRGNVDCIVPKLGADCMSCTFVPHRQSAVAKRGAHFTLMVVGESGLGKTTLM